jgi:hypothetical protein
MSPILVPVHPPFGTMTGETILPDESNELLGGVVGVIWSDNQVTMTCATDKSKDPNEIFLQN